MDGQEAGAAASLALALWEEVQGVHQSQEQEQGLGQQQPSSASSLSLRSRQLQQEQRRQRHTGAHAPPQSLPLTLLERLRARWSQVRKLEQQRITNDKGPDGRLLARGLLGLLLRCYPPPTSGDEVQETEAEAAVGHILPLTFVLLESYETEELQLLGCLAWTHAAAVPGFGRHIAWHAGIQVAVFARALKVCMCLRTQDIVPNGHVLTCI